MMFSDFEARVSRGVARGVTPEALKRLDGSYAELSHSLRGRCVPFHRSRTDDAHAWRGLAADLADRSEELVGYSVHDEGEDKRTIAVWFAA